MMREVLIIVLVVIPAIALPPPPPIHAAYASAPQATWSGLDSGYPGWIRVFFLPRMSRAARSYLVWLIDNASSNVYLAAYSFTDMEIADALVRAHSRGLDVRVVVDGDKAGSDAVYYLRSNGVPVRDDGNDERIQHNKFIVIDGRIVVTGSVNFNEYSFTGTYNNMVVVAHPLLAQNYRDEFMEMWGGTYHGGAPTQRTRMTILLNGTPVLVENYFSPDDSPATRLAELIDAAEREIDAMLLIITLSDVASRLVWKQVIEGVRVAVLVDDENAYARYSMYPYIEENGLMAETDHGSMILHDKVFVIDDVVWTGSMNPTYSGNSKNDENVLVIHDPRIAAMYREEFWRRFERYGLPVRISLVGSDGSCVTGAVVAIEDRNTGYRYVAYSVDGVAEAVLPGGDTGHLLSITVSYHGWLHRFTDTPVSRPATYTVTVPVDDGWRPPLVVNEVYPGESWWIELYNPGDQPVDLYGLVLSDLNIGVREGTLRFTEHRVVPGHGFVVVAYRATLFRQSYGFNPDYEVVDTDPSVPDVAVDGNYGPQPLGDEVMLVNGSRVISVVYYGSSWMGPRPGPVPEPGESLGLAVDGVVTEYMDVDLVILSPSPGRGNNGAPAPITEAPPILLAVIVVATATAVVLLSRHGHRAAV